MYEALLTWLTPRKGIAAYRKARAEYEAGDDSARERMLYAMTPAVAELIGRIEHDAAVLRRQRSEEAEAAQQAAAAAQRAYRRSVIRQRVFLYGGPAIAIAVPLLAIGLSLSSHHAESSVVQNSQIGENTLSDCRYARGTHAEIFSPDTGQPVRTITLSPATLICVTPDGTYVGDTLYVYDTVTVKP